MSLDVESKYTDITSVTALIKTKFSTCLDYKVGLVTISQIIDDCILAKSLSIKDLCVARILEEFGSNTSALTGYGLPCGTKQILDVLNVESSFNLKTEILGKMSTGKPFDKSSGDLQTIYVTTSPGDCDTLGTALNSVCIDTNTSLSLLNQALAAFAIFSSLCNRSTQVLGLIGQAFGCGASFFNSLNITAPWMSSVNSDLGVSITKINSAKALFPTNPQRAVSYAKDQIVTTTGLDLNLIDSKNNLANINSLI